MESEKNNVAAENKPTRGRPPQKRRWREIEAIKDEHKLRQELKELGFNSDFDD